MGFVGWSQCTDIDHESDRHFFARTLQLKAVFEGVPVSADTATRRVRLRTASQLRTDGVSEKEKELALCVCWVIRFMEHTSEVATAG
jgi:hypothetical protein